MKRVKLGTARCIRFEGIHHMYGEHATLTLKIQGNGFLIVSHQRIEDEARKSQ
jgi:hypothetical protein